MAPRRCQIRAELRLVADRGEHRREDLHRVDLEMREPQAEGGQPRQEHREGQEDQAEGLKRERERR